MSLKNLRAGFQYESNKVDILRKKDSVAVTVGQILKEVLFLRIRGPCLSGQSFYDPIIDNDFLKHITYNEFLSTPVVRTCSQRWSLVVLELCQIDTENWPNTLLQALAEKKYP